MDTRSGRDWPVIPAQHGIKNIVEVRQIQEDITVIALWLGHESIQTTHGYVEADLATKEQMLARMTPAGQNAHRFKADDTLLRFLSTL